MRQCAASESILRLICPQVTARAKDSLAASAMAAHAEDTIASARVLAESPRGSNGVQTAVLMDSHGRAAGEVTGHRLSSICDDIMLSSVVYELVAAAASW